MSASTIPKMTARTLPSVSCVSLIDNSAGRLHPLKIPFRKRALL